jgi:hypothetical protein
MEHANPEGETSGARRAMPPAPKPAQSSKEHPSDIAAIEDEGDEPLPDSPDADARRAFEVLEIRTPLEEYESYVRARIDTLARLGDTERAGLTAEALEIGRKAIARVTGVAAPEKPQAGGRS